MQKSQANLFSKPMVCCSLALLWCATTLRLPAAEAEIRQRGNTWTLATAKVKRVVALEAGKFMLKGFADRVTGNELLGPGALSDEFFFSLYNRSNRVTGSTGTWKLAGAQVNTLKNGERRLDIALLQGPVQVTKSYVLYPGSSIIREWVTLKNISSGPIQVCDPGFLNVSLRPGSPADLQFHWMSGGENVPGSWKLRTESLDARGPRCFDSYEPFSLDKTDLEKLPGDGTKARILLNDQPVWPAEGWQFTGNATDRAPFAFQADVKAGDRLVFLVNMNTNIWYDTTVFDPTITYEDGETHTASKEFGRTQGERDWHYQYLEGGKFIDLVYYSGPNQWRKEKDNATGTPFVGPDSQHPDSGQDAARVWTAPKSGSVRVTGLVCNTGNGGVSAAGYGFRPGSASYAPWYALYGRQSRQGCFIGWDYFGHWTSSFALAADGTVTAQLKVAGHQQSLQPGESLTSPQAFVGLYAEDLDNAGNECLDWQYRYMWDYTREGWFPAIRMLGYWYQGTMWGQPGAAWTGGEPDCASTFRKVFRVADLMRYAGGDVYHRDWGWWDRAGDWNGPDFRATGDYLRKYGMGQLIYAFLYTADPQSQVARAHPDWLLGQTLDLSRPEVVEFIKSQLDGFVKRWGNFEWRNDSCFTAARDGDDTPMLGQDQGFRRVLRQFLDAHPRCAFQSVNGGGNYGGYDYTRYSSSFSFSDGAVGILRNYYAALLFPPDKTSDIPDLYDPNKYDRASWRGLLCINFDMTGDTWDSAKLEGVRELIDIYHYLHHQGVVGRWVKVYRPIVQGEDPTMYFQRLCQDRKRGIIIPKRPAPGPVTIRPKGLLPDANYVVTFHESPAQETRRGADLMQRGITIEKMPPGELIYLNLPLHPGSKLDQQPPSPPRSVSKRRGENMGYPGVELSWKPGTDDNWISYYEVFRDGVALDKVAKGTFYFDHSAGADPAARYEIRTVDGAGNTSATSLARGPSCSPARVVDDAAEGGFRFSGEWKHERDLLPAHAQTLSSSSQKGAAAEVQFEGRRVLVFTKLGPNGGKARISLNGIPVEVIDTYSADDIWGICTFRKTLANAGAQTLRIEVLGERSPRAKDNLVALDGIRVETE